MEYIREYLLSVTGVMLAVAVIEFLMPSDGFKKYIKTVLGVVVLVTLAQPIMNFSNFKIFSDKYTFSGSLSDYSANEAYAAANADTIIKEEFEKNLCKSVEEEVNKELLKNCRVSAKFDEVESLRLYITCKDADFLQISEYVLKKYGLECEKKQNTGY